MREFKRKRGFFTFAQNTGTTDYLRLAYGLALSLKATQKEHGYLSVAITPGQMVPEKYRLVFDEIIEIPWGDNAKDSDWKLENEWKAYHITPYEETIKLDCDMLFFEDYSKYWDFFSKKDMVICNDVLTYRNELVTSDYHRKAFVENKLPNCYSAITYFKQSDLALDFFYLLELITFNWDLFTWEFAKEKRTKNFTTDVGYGIAAKILNDENLLFSDHDIPRFIHMKSNIQNWSEESLDEDWSKYVKVFFKPDLTCKIGSFQITKPLHYHNKSFLTDEILSFYERRLGINQN